MSVSYSGRVHWSFKTARFTVELTMTRVRGYQYHGDHENGETRKYKMQIITGLSPAARADLIAFCADNLKTDYDADNYADGLIDAADFSDGAHFEIRGLHTQTGNPITISYGQDSDLTLAEIEEDGEVIG